MLSATRSERNYLWVVVLAAGIVRVTAGLACLPRYESDPDAYRAIAETVATTGVYGLTDPQGRGQPTAFRPPLYPWLLSWLTVDGRLPSVAVAILHGILGAITAGCTYLAARRMLETTSPSVPALIAAALVTVDPILVGQSTWVMTETMAAALASLIILCGGWCKSGLGVRGGWLVGLTMSLAFLCRPTFVVWTAVWCGMMLVAAWRSPSRAANRPPTADDRSSRLWPAVIVAGMVAITIGLWTIRNARQLGHPIWATTHGGYTLLLGNNPFFYDYLRNGSVAVAWDPGPFFVAYSHRYDSDPTTASFWETRWDGLARELPRVSEHEDDQVSYRAARATIAREPAMFLWSCVIRFGRLWTPLPHHTQDRSWLSVAAIGTYYSLFYVAVLAGCLRLGRPLLGPRWWPVWALAVALSLVHTVYWSNLRMRAPIIPGLAIVASAAFLGKPPPEIRYNGNGCRYVNLPRTPPCGQRLTDRGS